MDVASRLYYDEGIRGFYRGVVPRMANVALWGTCMVTGYEFLSKSNTLFEFLCSPPSILAFKLVFVQSELVYANKREVKILYKTRTEGRWFRLIIQPSPETSDTGLIIIEEQDFKISLQLRSEFVPVELLELS